MAKQENQQNEYRAERKKRLAKNSKKNKKSSFDSVTVTTWIIRVICIVVVVAAFGFGLYQFGVPQKIMPAVKVGDRTYSVAEYGFYYTNAYQQVAQQAQSDSTSSSLASLLGTSFDSTKDPSLQYTTDDDGNKISYDTLFRQSAISQMETTNYYLELCGKENVTLSEENQKEIDEYMAEFETVTANSGYSVSRYISLVYGKGLNEKTLRKLISEQYLVSQYLEDVQNSYTDGITDEELSAALEEHADEFESVDLRLFGFEIADYEDETETESTSATDTTESENDETADSAADESTSAADENADETTSAADEETTAAEEEEEKEPSKTELLAQAMCDKITDEDSFVQLAYENCAEDDKDTFKDDGATFAKGIKKSAVSSNIGEELAEWLYSSERNVGDKRIYTTDEYVYVLYIVATKYIEETPLVDARHILVSFESVASELAANEDNEIDTEQDDDVEVKTATTDDNVEITNKGTGYSIELVTEAYKQANAIREKYLQENANSGAGETYFAELAEENSDDTGSVGDDTLGGGLYEDIEKGTMVTEFEDWVYDEARQPGDIGLIMTEYGWHVMYFVKSHDDPAWKESAKELVTSEKYGAYSDEIEAEVDGTAKEALFCSFAGNEARKNVTQ